MLPTLMKNPPKLEKTLDARHKKAQDKIVRYTIR